MNISGSLACRIGTSEKSRRGLGWYFTQYNPETCEGEGWFGTEDEPEYSFEDKIFEGDDGEPVLMSRTCGIGDGCFWTEWR